MLYFMDLFKYNTKNNNKYKLILIKKNENRDR